MRSTQVPDAPCPHCGARLDGALNVSGDEPPEPGDFSVCIKCGGLAVFTQLLGLREVLPHDCADMPDDLLVELHRVMVEVERFKEVRHG